MDHPHLAIRQLRGVRALVIGDPHFMKSNITEVDAFISKTITAVARLQPDIIVCLGDLLDSHEITHMSPFLRACRFMELLAALALTFLLVGNHDRRNNSDFLSAEHFFAPLKHIPNLRVVDYPRKELIQARSGATASFLFVPYVAPGRFYEALDHIDLSELAEQGGWRSPSIDAIFCHQEFRGVQLGPAPSTVGDVWAPDWPLIISGHIHEYQLLQPNLLYVGTPMQKTFHEAANKALALVEFNQDAAYPALPLGRVATLEELLPDPGIHARFVRITLDLQVKRAITLSVAELAQFRPFEGELMKLIITGTPAELKALSRTSRLAQLRKYGVKFALKPIEEKPRDRTTDPANEHTAPDSNAPGERRFLTLFRELIATDADLLPFFDALFREHATGGGESGGSAPRPTRPTPRSPAPSVVQALSQAPAQTPAQTPTRRLHIRRPTTSV